MRGGKCPTLSFKSPSAKRRMARDLHRSEPKGQHVRPDPCFLSSRMKEKHWEIMARTSLCGDRRPDVAKEGACTQRHFLYSTS